MECAAWHGATRSTLVATILRKERDRKVSLAQVKRKSDLSF